MPKLKVLITSPSIDTKDNIGGISNLTKLFIENNTEVSYELFIAGKKDNERRGMFWVIRQIIVLAKFLKKLNSREVAFVHINMPLEKAAIVRDAFFTLMCKLKRKKCLIHIHGGKYSKDYNIPFSLKYAVKCSLKYASHIIVLGEKELVFFQELYQVNNEKITVLQNCVGVPQNLSNNIKGKGTINLLYLGRIDKNKGLQEILQALSSLSESVDFILHIAGDGNEREWFIKECKVRFGDKTQYHGVVSGDKKIQLLKLSHVFLLPSYFEGLPIALLEAMAFGVVPIVTRVGSIPEVVQDNVNGVFVEIKNSISLVEKLNSIFNNRENLEKMAVESYKTIKDNFSIEEYIKSLNQIYSEL